MRRLSRPVVVMALVGLALVTAMAAFSSPLRRLPAPSPHQVLPAPARDVLASLPLAFEPAGPETFRVRGPGYSLALTPADAVVALAGGSFRLRPAGQDANPTPRLAGRQALPGTVNRLEGDNPAGWTTNLPTYGVVVAEQVWPGVDMVWHGDQRRLEHDVVIAPGADPGIVALDVEGTGTGPVAVDAGGDLLVDVGGATARLSRPVAYQDIGGSRRPVAGSFTVLSPNRIGFSVGDYDRRAPLVIDPTLASSTTLGGSGADLGYSIAVDAGGNTYVTGSTESTDFPTATPLQPALSVAASGPSTDVFVSKLSPDGTALLWSTYLGGKGRDTGYSVAVGTNGSVYVSGVTESSDFPRVKAVQDTYGGGPSDAFVARLAANGAALEWSTFLGGTQTDRSRGVAVDAAGNAYVTGSTSSVDFPSLNAQQPGPYRPDDVDAFIAKISAAGQLGYSTRLGGSNDDHGLAVAVDGQGAAYVTGDTLSPGFPTVRPLQAASGGSASGVAGSFPDAFVAKFTPAGSALAYSTFLGGSDYDQGTAIAVDTAGAVYLTGSTNSPNFPTLSALQSRKDGDADAFAAKIDPAGAALVYSTYLGGGGADGGNGITVDAAGDAFVTGTTGSTNWPTVKPVQPAKNGGDDAFVVKLNPPGNSLLFSTYVGGRESDSGMSVAIDGRGAVHVLGLTASPDFPQVKPLTSSRPPAGGDAFVASMTVADATTPAPAAASPAASSSSGHDRRVRTLGALTLGLLLVAGLQTVYLRRHTPAPAAGPKPDARPAPRPAGTAPAGLRILDDAGIGAGPAKAKAAAGSGSASKAAGASKSNRSPKARGGPKSGTGASKATGPRSKQGAGARAGAVPARGADDGGDPTMAMPPPIPARPREPAIAQLLEEDLWAPEPAAGPAPPISPEPEPAARAPEPPPPAGGAEVPPVQVQAIPPVPAEELSFWDLFPEDLPPARPMTFPVEDLLADHLALPDGPESVAARHATGAPRPEPVEPPAPEPTDAGPTPARPARSPDAEIVIAELLDGPVPTGVRPSAASPWAPAPAGDDFVISDLLADQRQGPEGQADDTDDDDPGPPPPGAGRPAPADQARIAADQARRRRARRGGRPGGG